jgi:curved DNA-binding protein CbpA
VVFKDYYALLAISASASAEEVKLAFRTQAIKWHPDKNPGLDTTRQMQEINEAYIILKDEEARAKYDREYLHYQAAFRAEQASKEKTSTYTHKPSNAPPKPAAQAPQYQFEDEILEKWMKNAQRQSVSLAEQTIRDFRGMVSAGAKAAVKDGGRAILVQLSLAAIGLLILTLSKSCS